MAHAVLQIDLSSEDAELATDALFECGAGGVEEQGTRRKTRLVVYGGSVEELEPLRAALPAALEQRGIAATRYRISVRAETGTDWERAYLDHLQPVEIAPGYWLRPTHDTSELPAGARVLLYEPDMAFGDGGHVTTHLAARAVVEQVTARPGATVFDYGAGNGVLALIALLAGAGSAAGLDIEPRSVAAACKNAALNGLSASFDLPGEAAPGPFDVVVANLEEPALLSCHQDIARRVKPDGVLVVTGFLCEREPLVVAAFAAHALAPVRTSRDADWSLVELARR